MTSQPAIDVDAINHGMQSAHDAFRHQLFYPAVAIMAAMALVAFVLRLPVVPGRILPLFSVLSICIYAIFQ